MIGGGGGGGHAGGGVCGVTELLFELDRGFTFVWMLEDCKHWVLAILVAVLSSAEPKLKLESPLNSGKSNNFARLDELVTIGGCWDLSLPNRFRLLL